jgi:hypothetical protein
MANSSSRPGSPSARPLRQRLLRWQVSRTWARLIREAEAPLARGCARSCAGWPPRSWDPCCGRRCRPRLRRRVNRWLRCFGVQTRLNP